MASDADGKLGYRPELDFLRAVALATVLYAHFWNDDSVVGQLGVHLFFVLSGFLITDILLGIRSRVEADPKRRLWHLRNFFIRRGLRIWPAYYLALGLSVLFNFQDIRPIAPWHALFATNILFSIRNDHIPWALSAWWSLSVEEQFYLLWPAVVCLARRSLLPWIVGVLIYAGILFNFAMGYIGYEGLATYYLPPAAFASLGAGAAMALLRQRHGMIPRLIEQAGWISAPLVILLTALGWTDWVWASLNVLPMMALISWAVRVERGAILSITRFRPFLWMGKISYGVYLYHLFVMAFLFWLIPEVPSFDHRGPILFAAGAALSMIVASLSWHLIEAPCNRLKRFFPYVPVRPADRAGTDQRPLNCTASGAAA